MNINNLKTCPYCDSIYVCWNWMNCFCGDAQQMIDKNLHCNYTLDNVPMWRHECWDCGGCFDTHDKVSTGIKYDDLKDADKNGLVKDYLTNK